MFQQQLEGQSLEQKSAAEVGTPHVQYSHVAAFLWNPTYSEKSSLRVKGIRPCLSDDGDEMQIGADRDRVGLNGNCGSSRLEIIRMRVWRNHESDIPFNLLITKPYLSYNPTTCAH